MGLGQVRELRRKAIAGILDERQRQPFHSLDDFLRRAKPRRLEAENLIKAGGLDGLGTGRKAMLAELGGRLPGTPLQLAFPLGWMAETPQVEYTLIEKLACESQLLGWPVSAHPLTPFAQELASQGVVPSDALVGRSGEQVLAAGARLSLWGARRGQITMEDEAGLFSLLPPPGQRLSPGSLGKLGPYLISGRVQVDQAGGVSIHADIISPL